MFDQLGIKATVTKKISKYDEHNNLIGVEEETFELSQEEAKKLWDLQQAR